MTPPKTLILVAASSLALVAGASGASAKDWAASHRRVEVNARLANQNRRINTEVKDAT